MGRKYFRVLLSTKYIFSVTDWFVGFNNIKVSRLGFVKPMKED